MCDPIPGSVTAAEAASIKELARQLAEMDLESKTAEDLDATPSAAVAVQNATETFTPDVKSMLCMLLLHCGLVAGNLVITSYQVAGGLNVCSLNLFFVHAALFKGFIGPKVGQRVELCGVHFHVRTRIRT